MLHDDSGTLSIHVDKCFEFQYYICLLIAIFTFILKENGDLYQPFQFNLIQVSGACTEYNQICEGHSPIFCYFMV